MAGSIQQCQHRNSYPPLEENHGKEDMKDVACVILANPTPILWEYTFTVYLIDITRQKLISFLHLNENYPSNLAFLAHNSMLYMFGGEQRRRRHIAVADAYVLDLSELAKTHSDNNNNNKKPTPTKLPPMNSPKFDPMVSRLTNNIICVFDYSLGHEPTACHFELFDPHHNTWTKVPDPCSFIKGCYVDAHYVKDDKLFIYVGNKDSVFVLNVGPTISSSPSWMSYVDMMGSCLTYDPFTESKAVILGSWLVDSRHVFDLADQRPFARPVGSVVWTDKTGAKPYEIIYAPDDKIFRLGGDRVCTIRPAIVYKPKHMKIRERRVKMDGRRSMFIQQSLILKCQRRRIGSYRFIVNICSVNANSRDKKVEMEVLKSFTVPMYRYRDNCKVKSYSMPLSPNGGFSEILMVSLCNP